MEVVEGVSLDQESVKGRALQAYNYDRCYSPQAKGLKTHHVMTYNKKPPFVATDSKS